MLQQQKVLLLSALPVVHESEFTIWWFQLQRSFRIESVQRHAFMEVAVIQHDNLIWIPATKVGGCPTLAATNS